MDAGSNAAAARQRAAQTKQTRTREAILEAATRFLQEEGKFTLIELSARAGCGSATIFNHFSTIDGVIVAVWCDELERAFQDWNESGSAAERLVHCIWEQIQHLAKSSFPLREAHVLERLVEANLMKSAISPVGLSIQALASVITSLLVRPFGSVTGVSEQSAQVVFMSAIRPA